MNGVKRELIKFKSILKNRVKFYHRESIIEKGGFMIVKRIPFLWFY